MQHSAKIKNSKTVKLERNFQESTKCNFIKANMLLSWNFFFETHVCLRYRYNTLQQKVLALLSHAKEETRKVVTFIIAHEPGAGATTIGHQPLWHFRTKYRCYVVQKLSDTTIMELLSFWKYKENEDSESLPKPIVILMDDIVQTGLSESEFTRQLYIEFGKTDLNNGLNCLIIFCRREEKFNDYDYESQSIFYLKQELCQKKKIWFTDKFDELERTGRELDLNEYKP